MLDLAMLRIPAKLYLLVIFSTLLQVASFPFSGPLPYWRSSLAWIALVPFFLALTGRNSRSLPLCGSQHFVLGYLCGILFYVGNCSWIYQTMYLYGGLPKPVALVILFLFSAYLGLYLGLFGWVYGAMQRSSLGRGGALVLAPFLWVAVELARARITGFPWDLLGYSQIDNWLLLRVAPLAGVMGISFVVAAVNAAIAYGVMSDKRKLQAGLPIGALCVMVIVVIFGRVSGSPLANAPEHAVLLQENLSVGATARGRQPASAREETEEFSRLSLMPLQNGQHSLEKPSIILWPEAPSHLFSNDPGLREALGQLAQRADAPLIIGSLGLDQNPSSAKGYSVFDSAALFDRSGSFAGRYDKIHLVPWGEYVPYKQFFSFAQKLTEGVGDMDRGSARTVFRTDGHAYGVFICYESIFGDEVREFVQNGADVLVNISDDGWYGDTGAPWQHLDMARMRAVENQRWVLRDTNTGETTVIDPEGRYTQTERHVRTSYLLPFAFTSGLTLYTRFGDWFAYLAAAVTLCGLGYGLLQRKGLK